MVKKKEVPRKSSNIFRNLLIVSTIVFILQAIFVFIPLLHQNMNVHDIVGNIFIVLLSLIAFISSILIYRRISDNFPREKKAKGFLIISLFLFLIGDLSWLVSEVFFGDLNPIGSYPDYIWISAYAFLIIALFYFIAIGFRPSRFMIYAIAILGVVMGGVILYADVVEDLEENSFTYAHAIQDSYIIFDLLAFLLVIYLVLPIIPAGRRFYLNWLILGVGIFTRLVYDQLFAEMSQTGAYYTGHPIDLLYVFFYVCVVISFYYKSQLLEGNIK